MEKAALLSVSDRTGLGDFAACLHRAGYQLLATTGTAKDLVQARVPVTPIEELTRQPEILGGRVKTLHPAIHAGILARRDVPQDLIELQASGALPIDIVVVNLYPFVAGLGDVRRNDPMKMIDLVDVGGPTMIRAAAKNHRFVVPVIDPADYEWIGEHIRRSGSSEGIDLEKRRELAVKVFAALSQYDFEVARYFSTKTESTNPRFVRLRFVRPMVTRSSISRHLQAGYGGVLSFFATARILISGPHTLNHLAQDLRHGVSIAERTFHTIICSTLMPL